VSTFAKIILVARYRKVNYYSVQIEDNEPLFKQFIEKHGIENPIKLHHIMSWLRVIGDNIGAYPDYFRNESETADTSALPPIGNDREPTYVEFNEETGQDENASNDLRLYCMRISENVVVLFNGDVKTAEKAQECDNVKHHFRLANKITNSIDIALISKEIDWNTDNTDIIFDDDFELNW